MTSDQLKELERLSERWANPDNFKNDTAISHAVMDLLPDVIAHIKDLERGIDGMHHSVASMELVRRGLEAERDALRDLVDKATHVGCGNAFTTQITRIQAERDAAIQGMMNETTRVNSFINDTIVLRQERDAALKALDAANAKCADLQLTIDGLNVGYHADSEWRIVVEALKWAHNREQSACICGESGENHTECPVAKALAHAERITGGGK